MGQNHAALCTVRSKLARKMQGAKAKRAGLPKRKKGQVCVALFPQDHPEKRKEASGGGRGDSLG